jgi:outer membrane protein OmpA-like peptidoglycan-associated protein
MKQLHNKHPRLTAIGATPLLLAATLYGCGASVPVELVNARGAIARVNAGPTSANNPAGLHTAKQTLAAAEHYYEEEGDTQETRDLAYTAERRAQTAEVKGRSLAWSMEAEQAKQQAEQAEAARLASTTEELAQAKSKLQQQEQQLAAERERRAEAEKRAKEAAEMLAKFATVKQESRGMVITLSGNVLFETNKSKLFPQAQVKLSEVAKALTQQDPDSQIVVEGHADSQGDDQHNLELSQARAEAVREYLIAQGIAADRIVAKGFGETRPIADNGSPEGRANNRRVEIVVQGSSGIGSAASQSGQSQSGQSSSAASGAQSQSASQGANSATTTQGAPATNGATGNGAGNAGATPAAPRSNTTQSGAGQTSAR